MTTAGIISENTTVQSILSEYESILEEADRLFQDYVRTHSLKITCGPSCSECCSYYVPLYFIEAYYIQMGVKLLTPRTRHAIRFDALRSIPRIERLEKIVEAVEERSGGVVKEARSSLDYLLRRAIKCPFEGGHMGMNGCMVHKYRPIIARLFGVPLVIREHQETPIWCDENTPTPDSPPPLNACRLKGRVTELSSTLEFLLTGKRHPKRLVWFYALFPIEKFIEGGKIMAKKEISPEEQRRDVRRRLLKLGMYSVPAIATVLATKGAYGQGIYKSSQGSGTKNKSSGFS